jgi:hypothetical protein
MVRSEAVLVLVGARLASPLLCSTHGDRRKASGEASLAPTRMKASAAFGPHSVRENAR